MLRRVRRGAGFLTAAWLALFGSGSAEAGGLDEELFIRPEDQRTSLFASVDAGRSVFATVGAKQTLTGPLDRPGFLAMESEGIGLTRETVRGLPALRLATQSSVIVGHQWLFPGLYVAALAGPELQHEQLTVAGRIDRFSKPLYGAKGQVEIWSNPTDATLLTGTVVASSARFSLWARGSAGIGIGRNLFLGPEVTAYATETYREIKAGAHLTGFSVGIVQGRLSAGMMMSDDGHRPTPYLGLAAWIRM